MLANVSWTKRSCRSFCRPHYAPVCASNAHTYGNKCQFASAKKCGTLEPSAKLISKGRCKEVGTPLDEAFGNVISVDRSMKPYRVIVRLARWKLPTARGEIDESNNQIQTGFVHFPNDRKYKFWYRTDEATVYWDADKGKTRNIWRGKRRSLKTMSICENTGKHLLKCTGSGSVIDIVAANYGRLDNTTCKIRGWSSNTNCGEVISLHIMKSFCNGKKRCSVGAWSSLFGDPCPETYKSLTVLYQCKKTTSWVFQKSNVCFGTRHNRHGTFRLKQKGTLIGLKLVHKGGFVRCNDNYAYNSNWGCSTKWISVHITDKTNKQIFPKDVTYAVGYKRAWYAIPGYTSKSPVLVFTDDVSSAMLVQEGQELRLWYGEDLKNLTEFDNAGTSCADVYAKFA